MKYLIRCIIFGVTILIKINISFAQWIKVFNPDAFSTNTIKSITVEDSIVFIGVWNKGIFRSTNNGLTWDSVNTGLPQNKFVNTLARNGSNLFTGIGNEIYLSINNGETWNGVNNGIYGDWPIWDFDFIGSEVFVGILGSGVFRSTNKGTN